MSETSYGSTSEGVRGIIDGVYSFYGVDNLLHGDILIDEKQNSYRVFYTDSLGAFGSSFPSKFIALRVQ